MSVAQNHVNALKAVKAKSFVGATYFPPKLNAISPTISASRFHRARHGRHRRAVRQGAGAGEPAGLRAHQAQLPQGQGRRRDLHARLGWRTLDIIATLEQDLQVPVVHPVTARVWEMQKRLHVREPRQGFGHLLAALP